MKKDPQVIRSSIFSPFILLLNLSLLFRSINNQYKFPNNLEGELREVVGDIECLPDFFWRFAFDHICDSLATSIKKRLNIQIIRSLDTCQYMT